MSLYNIVHGENPYASMLLAILGMTRGYIPRYRDCWWTGTHIAVYTRVGGNNREDYSGSIEELESHPSYAYDEDDGFDDTYATFYFDVPEALKWTIPHLQAEASSPEEKWTTFMAKLEDPACQNDPQVEAAMAAFAPIFQQIKAHLDPEAPSEG